jgi:hypothetical protein
MLRSTKLKGAILPRRDNYEPIAANHEFLFIVVDFNPYSKAYKATRICPKEYHEDIWNLMDKHLHKHTSNMIRKQAVLEMYTYCKNVWVWSYNVNGILRIDGICGRIQFLILYLY